uniref:RNase H type-1 domain-containing protein n=1 Tax=Cannabis sativa TaxID=3483 RepID=A0A803Q8L6_CANSA
MCTNAWESIGHALFSCKHAKSGWENTGFSFDFRQAQQMSNGDYLFHLSTLHSQLDFELIICTMWAIWSSRNKNLHGSASSDGTTTAATTTAAPTATSSSNSHNVTAVRLQPPTGMGLKINIDAVVNSAAKKLGVGAIGRDHGGHVVAALSKSVQGCFRSDEMEGKALFHSLNWVLQHQISITNIETDALRVFQALTSTSTDLSSF